MFTNKFCLALVLAVIMWVATGCGKAEDPINYIPDTPKVVVPTVPSAPIAPSGPAGSSPNCKAFQSIWYTISTPENTLMGRPITGGYQLDLSNLASGSNNASFLNDATHACLYTIQRVASNYTIKNFQGCNPGVIPPGGTVNDQCNYCPSVAPSATILNIEYDYTLTCNSLTITDKNTAKSVVYF